MAMKLITMPGCLCVCTTHTRLPTDKIFQMKIHTHCLRKLKNCKDFWIPNIAMQLCGNPFSSAVKWDNKEIKLFTMMKFHVPKKTNAMHFRLFLWSEPSICARVCLFLVRVCNVYFLLGKLTTTLWSFPF